MLSRLKIRGKNKKYLSAAMKALETDPRFTPPLNDPNLNAYLRFHGLYGFLKCCMVDIRDKEEL
jgi:hypothetical protein